MSSICIQGQLMDFDAPKIMGIVNLTPDSFYSQSRSSEHLDALFSKVQHFIDEGADFIDVGAVSTRPNFRPVSYQEEQERLSVLPLLLKNFPTTYFSLDTYHYETMLWGLDHGVHLINDISGGRWDCRILEYIAQNTIPYILTHSTGTPATLHEPLKEGGSVDSVFYWFSEHLYHLRAKGTSSILLDVGLGFSKTLEQNYQLLNHLHLFKQFQAPLVVGLSRKSMIYKVLETDPESALNGTTVLHTLAILNGANVLRVHDVKATKEVLKLLHYSNAQKLSQDTIYHSISI